MGWTRTTQTQISAPLYISCDLEEESYLPPPPRQGVGQGDSNYILHRSCVRQDSVLFKSIGPGGDSQSLIAGFAFKVSCRSPNLSSSNSLLHETLDPLQI